MLVRARGFGMHHDQTCMHRTYTVYNRLLWSKHQNLTPPAHSALPQSPQYWANSQFFYYKTYMHEAPNGSRRWLKQRVFFVQVGTCTIGWHEEQDARHHAHGAYHALTTH